MTCLYHSIMVASLLLLIYKIKCTFSAKQQPRFKFFHLVCQILKHGCSYLLKSQTEQSDYHQRPSCPTLDLCSQRPNTASGFILSFLRLRILLYLLCCSTFSTYSTTSVLNFFNAVFFFNFFVVFNSIDDFFKFFDFLGSLFLTSTSSNYLSLT